MAESPKTRGRAREPLATINPTAAGIDVGATFHVVAVPGDWDDRPVRTFRTFSGDLQLVPEAEARAIPHQDLHPVARAVAEHEQMSREGILVDHLARQGGEPIERQMHVSGRRRDEDADRRRPAQHRAAATVTSTCRSHSASTRPRTRTSRPGSRTISSSPPPALVMLLGIAGRRPGVGTTWTGTKARDRGGRPRPDDPGRPAPAGWDNFHFQKLRLRRLMPRCRQNSACLSPLRPHSSMRARQ
jgi:hypothetical protein